MKKIILFLLFTPQILFSQTITTIAGTGFSGFSGDGSGATNAKIHLPYGVDVDKRGNVYIADFQNNRIRKIDAITGIITTIAGTGDTCNHMNLPISGLAATSIPIEKPAFITVDDTGNLYTSCANSFVIKINTSGIASTIANVKAQDLAIDPSGNLYMTDGFTTIYKREATSGLILVYAGKDTLGFSGDGGIATNAKLNYPYGIGIDHSNNLYLTDGNGRIRKVDASTHIISTIAGTGSSGYSGDGYPATICEMRIPTDIVLDASNNIYIAEYGSHVIRKINSATGIITTLAGNGTPGYFGDGLPLNLSKLNEPNRLVLDTAGNLYISDFANNRIRKITIRPNEIENEPMENNQFSISPNPATSKCIISVAGLINPNAAITIYDISGSIILSQPLINNNTEVSIQGICTGIYFCRIFDGIAYSTKKLTVIK